MKHIVLGEYIGAYALCLEHTPTEPAWFARVERATRGLRVVTVAHEVAGRGKPDRVEFSAKTAAPLRRLASRLRCLGRTHMVLAYGPAERKLPLRVEA